MRTPNLDSSIVYTISKKTGLEFVPEVSEGKSYELLSTPKSLQSKQFSPLDLLDYIYAVLHAPWFRSSYSEFLKIDFPWIPYPCSGIVNAEAMESFSNLHLFLQGIRGKHIFEGNPPFSVLVCNIHDLGQRRNFDFKDDLLQFAISVRMGETGAIVCFQDCGLTKDTYGKYVMEVQGRKLHPIQFDELYAKACYQLHITEGHQKFLTVSHTEGQQVATTECFPSFQVGEWEQREYVKWLLTHVSHWLSGSQELEDHFQPPDHVSTWMANKAGELLLLPLDRWESNSKYTP